MELIQWEMEGITSQGVRIRPVMRPSSAGVMKTKVVELSKKDGSQFQKKAINSLKINRYKALKIPVVIPISIAFTCVVKKGGHPLKST